MSTRRFHATLLHDVDGDPHFRLVPECADPSEHVWCQADDLGRIYCKVCRAWGIRTKFTGNEFVALDDGESHVLFEFHKPEAPCPHVWRPLGEATRLGTIYRCILCGLPGRLDKMPGAALTSPFPAL